MLKETLSSITENTWVERISTFILSNILWMVLAVFIITLPLATAGLFAVITPMARGKSVVSWLVFFIAMRKYAVKSVLITVCDLLVGLFVWVNLSILGQMGLSNPIAILSLIITLFIAVMTLLMNVYVWPLMVTHDLPLKQLIRIAFKMSAIHPAWSLLIAILAALPVLSIVLLPGFFVLLGVYSGCAFVASWGAWRVLEKYHLETL